MKNQLRMVKAVVVRIIDGDILELLVTDNRKTFKSHINPKYVPYTLPEWMNGRVAFGAKEFFHRLFVKDEITLYGCPERHHYEQWTHTRLWASAHIFHTVTFKVSVSKKGRTFLVAQGTLADMVAGKKVIPPHAKWQELQNGIWSGVEKPSALNVVFGKKNLPPFRFSMKSEKPGAFLENIFQEAIGK